MTRAILVLGLLAVAGCVGPPTGDPPPIVDPTPEELPEFVFAGVDAVAVDGDFGLVASWTAADGAVDGVTYAVSIVDSEGTPVATKTTSEATESIDELPAGILTTTVVATDGGGRQAGGDVSLDLLVGPNRLQYRSEVPLPSSSDPGSVPGGADVWGEGDTLVIAGYMSGASFMIVDASDPDAPQVLHAEPEGGFVKDVKVGDGMLFTNAEPHPHDQPDVDGERHGLGSNDGIGARIWDWTNPEDPTLLAELGDPTLSAHNVSYAGGYLYATDNVGGGLHMWNVSDPSTPYLSWMWSPPSAFVHDVTAIGDRVYVAWWEGFAVLDVSDPLHPTEVVVHGYEQSACHNAWPTADGSHVLTSDEQPGGHLRIWDISDPSDVEQVGSWSATDDEMIHNVVVRDDLAFIAWYTAGLQVVDVSDPTSPQLVGWYDTWEQDPTPGDDDDAAPDPECLAECSDMCLKKCEGPDCESFCEDMCDEMCVPGNQDFGGAWGVWPFGDHIAVGDIDRGLVILDFWPGRVERGTE